MQGIILDVASRNLKGAKFRKNSEEVPGVVYGQSQEPVSISVAPNILKKAYQQVGGSRVIDLKIDEGKPIKVLFHEVQANPITGEPDHFDMYAVTLGRKMRTDVPLHFEGEPEIVKTGEGILVTIKDMIEVEANPLDLPEHITVDLSTLENIGDAIFVSDLSVKGDVVIVEEAEEAIVKIAAPKEEEPEEEPEELEATEGEESEAGEEESAEDSEDKSDSSE